ncbi:dipeptide epimerase [Spirulina sp. 06S082]|uniref:dipeptide epimerase n=1 Tax=Spirulina sp. 06S082 TaxID=3110248 RepID=UPI002B204288|nr:dipeptide epimerase [Spirulina sp. 06S082]MEA5472375.1 dipeptide epimerase [Spirulina sp. 06S082]
MQIKFQTFTVRKRVPLTISRGTSAGNTNIWVRLQHYGLEGWGEAMPFSIIQESKPSPEKLIEELNALIPSLEQFTPLERQKIEGVLQEAKTSTPVRAAIDMALYDWLGKRAYLPLWKLWGLDLSRIIPTSVTVGISSPEKAKERVRQWQQLLDAKVFKLKLGSPEGIEYDRALFLAEREEIPHAEISVDANGGWSLSDAIKMSQWLEKQGVCHLEQPLNVAAEKDFPILYEKSPLPIFIDESCFNSADILRLSHCIHGINVKIMKSGGLTEALNMIRIAKVLNLQIMYGCYSDSTLANTAMSQLAPYANYIDLDSHLNLVDDPFRGARLDNGRLVPRNFPGLGVELE